MCAQYSPAPSQNSTSRPLKTLPTTYLYEDGIQSYLIDTSNPSPDFYLNYESQEPNRASISPLSEQSYSTILPQRDLNKLAEFSPIHYPTLNIPNRNNPGPFRKHLEVKEKPLPFHIRNPERPSTPPEISHKIETAKSYYIIRLLDQLIVNRDRHIGLKSYFESLNQQLKQSLQIGIAELKAKRSAIMAQLDARLDENLHIIQIKHKEKEKVLKDKSQEVEWFLKGIQDSIQKLQDQLEGENRVNIFKNLDLILTEAEKGLSIWAPESDINSEWAYVNVPEFNYTLASNNAINNSSYTLHTPKSQSLSVKNSSKKISDVSDHFRRNFSETVSPIKGEDKKDRLYKEVSTSPIKEVSRITIDDSEILPSGSIDITKKREFDYEFDPLDTNRRRKLRPPRIPKLDLPNFEPGRKDQLIVELMKAYKELETFYNWSKYGFSVPEEMKPRSFQKIAEEVVDPANIESIKKEVTDRMLSMLKSSNIEASDYKSFLSDYNPESTKEKYYEKLLKSNQEMAQRIE